MNDHSRTPRSRASNSRVLDPESAARLAEMFGAFSDASRVRIISMLVDGELNVSTLAEAIGLSTSAVSHHLRGLRQLRLVRARKKGRQVFYRLDDHVAKAWVSITQVTKIHWSRTKR